MAKTEPQIEHTAELAIVEGRIPEGDKGIGAIADLVRKAQDVEIVTVRTDGLGHGLPATVPLLIDRASINCDRITSLSSLLEDYRHAPERRTGTAKADTLAAFIDLTNRHKTPASVIFARAAWPSPRLTTVIDYHSKDGTPGWCKHRIVYEFPITEEFKAWATQNGEPMGQAEFAAFLEDHAAELSAPFDQERSDYERLFKATFATPNVLIDLARHLEIFANHKVRQGVRLSSGESVVEFSEEHINGKGEPVNIPGVFMIAVPAFVGGAPIRIPARLRYRLAGGSIKWSFNLYRPAEWLREQVQADMATAAEKTGLPAYEGAPEVSA